MRLRITVFLFALCFIFASTDMGAANVAQMTGIAQVKGGGKEKKEKNKDTEAQAKMKKRRVYNPKKQAKASAKAARQATASKDKQIMYRAGVRNFFHRMFNSKHGKYRNFRSPRQRRRWSRGR